jgi:integrase
MTWDEVDLDLKVWTVPGARIKAGRPHRVPLSSRSIEFLQLAKTLTGDWETTRYVFPASRRKGTLSGVIDVYESQAKLDAFAAKLLPILQEMGIEAKATISEVYNIIEGRRGAVA